MRHILTATLVCVLCMTPPAQAYSVLTHEAIIDLAWKDGIKPVLSARFPAATVEDLPPSLTARRGQNYWAAWSRSGRAEPSVNLPRSESSAGSSCKHCTFHVSPVFCLKSRVGNLNASLTER